MSKNAGSMRTALVLCALMVLASGAAVLAKPRAKIADELPPLKLSLLIPNAFGVWRASPLPVRMVDPQTQETLDKLYTEVLNRVYINPSGYHVMLSIAYGDEQRGKLNVHRPENCYPAQGFAIREVERGDVQTPYGSIPVRRLSTSNGVRFEPLTYWVAVGGAAEQSRLQRRLLDLRMGLTGRIPDGMIVRVSSIDRDNKRAYEHQDDFINQLVHALPTADRKRVSGLGDGLKPL